LDFNPAVRTAGNRLNTSRSTSGRRYFNQDPAKKTTNKLLMAAQKDFTREGSTLEALEVAFARLLKCNNYVQSNDMWSWILYNFEAHFEDVQACLQQIRDGTGDGGDGAWGLHEMQECTAVSAVIFVICRAMSDEDSLSVTVTTGGKQSHVRQFFENLQCKYEIISSESFQVSLTPEFRAKWESAFNPRSRTQDGHRPRSNVYFIQPADALAEEVDTDWSDHKQDGVNRRAGQKRDTRKRIERESRELRGD
jgi:hypothetical protein